jgi:TPR repeat protein
LHVESVAWVSERKDLLSTLFWLLVMWVYREWTIRGGAARYATMTALFALGLAAKPMLVTVPIVLLLWDRWPLGRDRGPSRSEATGESTFARRLIEKAPLFTLAAGAGLITLAVQGRGGAMEVAAGIPAGAQAANAAVSYVRYLGKTVWPLDLSPFYPHPALPGGTPWGGIAVAGAVLVLLLLTLAAYRFRARGYPAVGWLWYLTTLLPVIGIVQVGRQAMADRYSYVPLIGIFILAAWGGDELSRRWAHHWRPARLTCAALATVLVVLCALGSARQVQHWRDSVSLFERALETAPATAVVHTNLGVALVARGETDEAAAHYRAALEIDPNHAEAHNGLGNLMRAAGELDAAIEHYRRAVGLDPATAATQNNLGVALLAAGRLDEAQRTLEIAYELAPTSSVITRGLAETRYRLGLARLHGEGAPRDDAAGARLLRAAGDLGHTRAQYDLGLLYDRGRGVPEDPAEAAAWYRRAAEAGVTEAQTGLGALYVQGRGVPIDDVEAERWFRAAARKADPQGLFNMGMLHLLGRATSASDLEAWIWFELSARAGNEAAVEWRDRSAERLDPAQLERARTKAGAWRPE